MSIWTFMNGAAWALSAGLFLWIARDFIRVERARRLENREAGGAKDDEP